MGEKPMDMSGLGAYASAPKGSGPSKELTDFTVKKGDNGGVVVCENYRSQAPEGRRAGASYPAKSDYKENPFGPNDGQAASDYISGLLSQMGIAVPEEQAEAEAPAGVPSLPNIAPAMDQSGY